VTDYGPDYKLIYRVAYKGFVVDLGTY